MVWIAPPARVGIDARTDNGDDNCARAWRHRRRLLRKFRLAGLVCVLMLAWTALTFARVFAAFEAPVQDRHIAAAAQKKGGSEAEQREESEEGRSTWRRLGATTPNDVAPAVESTTAASSLGRWLVDEMTTEGDDQEATNNSSSDACDQSALAKGGGWLRVVLLVAAILFAFNGIAIVCDEFFQASLEKISEVSSRLVNTPAVRPRGGTTLCMPRMRYVMVDFFYVIQSDLDVRLLPINKLHKVYSILRVCPFACLTFRCIMYLVFVNKNMNASKASEHPPIQT